MARRAPAKPDVAAILRALKEHRVRFVVGGGVAYAAHGLPHAPRDVDICSECEPENLLRLVSAMNDLEAAPTRRLSRRGWRRRAVAHARSEEYTWREIGLAATAWAVRRALRSIGRGPSAVGVKPEPEAHGPEDPRPEEFGLAHEKTVATKHGILTFYLFETPMFEVMSADAEQITVHDVEVPVSSLDYMIRVNVTYGRFKDHLKKRRLTRLRATQPAR